MSTGRANILVQKVQAGCAALKDGQLMTFDVLLSNLKKEAHKMIATTEADALFQRLTA